MVLVDVSSGHRGSQADQQGDWALGGEWGSGSPAAWLSAILGVIHAGAAAYVPADADDPGSRAEQIWEISAATASSVPD